MTADHGSAKYRPEKEEKRRFMSPVVVCAKVCFSELCGGGDRASSPVVEPSTTGFDDAKPSRHVIGRNRLRLETSRR
jgi:hypothetical protein